MLFIVVTRLPSLKRVLFHQKKYGAFRSEDWKAKNLKRSEIFWQKAKKQIWSKNSFR